MAQWLYYHQLDPFLIQFTENFGIRWYSLAYISGVVAVYFFSFYLVKKGRLCIPEAKIIDIVTYGAIGMVLGGRLGYGLFYNPSLFITFDGSFPFWDILKVHHGGMSSHGGILGLILSQWFYGRYHKISFYSLMDLMTLGSSLGIFLGRIANFINGELFGRVIEKKALLGVKFPSELFLWVERVEEYQSELISLKRVLPAFNNLSNLQMQIPHPYVWEEWVRRAVEDPAYKWRLSYISNLIVDMSKEPNVKVVLESLLSVRHPSQFYQAFFGGFVTFLIVSLVWLKPRKAGVISLVWFISYLVCRIFTEFFRMPDADIGYEFLYLTRGQWLSFAILISISGVYSYGIYNKSPKGFSL